MASRAQGLPLNQSLVTAAASLGQSNPAQDQSNQQAIAIEAIIYQHTVYSIASQEDNFPLLADKLVISIDQLSDLLTSTGLFFNDIEHLQEAKVMYEKALKVNIFCLGTDHIAIAKNHFNLGLALEALDDLEGAKKSFQQVIELQEAYLDPESKLEMALSYYNLGGVCFELEELHEAKVAFEKALEIRIKFLGENHSDVAQSHFFLGSVLQGQEDLDGAKEAYKKALTIWDELDVKNATVAECCTYLADLLQSQGDSVEAQKYHDKAEKIQEAINLMEANDQGR